jgi:pantetheine-phosphate adenylyltransferase
MGDNPNIAIEEYSDGVLKKYTIVNLDYVKRKYNENGRFYHNFDHILYMLRKGYEEQGEAFFLKEPLILAILFHDFELDDVSGSITALSKVVKGDLLMHWVIKSAYRLIGCTENHTPNDSKHSKKLIDLDLGILKEPFPKLIEYEHKIFKEYQKYDYSSYKIGRIMVLYELQKHTGIDLSKLIDYVEHREPKIGLYAGSFNPFHEGHYNILQKAEKIFDKVIIARGYNYNKPKTDKFPIPRIVENRQYIEYQNLLKDVLNGLDYPVTVIRGVRNGKDVEEDMKTMEMFDTSEINFVHIISNKEFRDISSTKIRKNMLVDFDFTKKSNNLKVY